MNGMVLLIVSICILVIAYLTYGRWLAKVWGVDPSRKTPAHTMEDGVDYVPAKAPVLLGHHFSSIAGAGPITGPIQAAVFGWVPVFLWVIIGGIFFGAVHDFGALFASIRNNGQSIGEVIATSMGRTAKKLFIVFSYLALILVVAAFTSIVASTFSATYNPDSTVNLGQSAPNARTAMISILFILVAVIFGLLVYRYKVSLMLSTLLGVGAIILCMIIGFNFHPFYLSYNAWMVIVGIYILIASVTPVWILLQPRDYLSSFLLYFMMIVACVGVIGSGIMGHGSMAIPSFTGFRDNQLGFMFPALFITIACGAISGFHSLVGSGTSSKQLDREEDALPIAYGSMLVECALAIVSLCAVGYIWNNFSSGEIRTPTEVFAVGISRMVATVPFLKNTENVVFSMLILTVSAFCLTSLDTATRLARYMFQEFWLEPGQTHKDASGFKVLLVNPFFSTIITVIMGVGLGMTGYTRIWPLFGAANQLLAALGLLAVATWLGKLGKNNKMFFFPMTFMMLVTVTSLFMTIQSRISTITSGDPWNIALLILAFLLVFLAIILAINGYKTLVKQKNSN